MGNWKPVFSVRRMESASGGIRGAEEGQTFSARGTRKYLLTGLLRCGRTYENGVVCNRSMAGFRYSNGRHSLLRYRCPDRIKGGCGGLQRSMPKLDKLIEDLLLRTRGTRQAIRRKTTGRRADTDAIQLAETQASIASSGWDTRRFPGLSATTRCSACCRNWKPPNAT